MKKQTFYKLYGWYMFLLGPILCSIFIIGGALISYCYLQIANLIPELNLKFIIVIIGLLWFFSFTILGILIMIYLSIEFEADEVDRKLRIINRKLNEIMRRLK